MYQTGGTIKDTIQDIQARKYVLPAIQREFVWWPEQIERLFDSLMQGYPFGTFLYWRVERANSGKYKFYEFVRDYHERDKSHCGELPLTNDAELTAVLDGQQRLTALNIGLAGSMAWRLPYQRKNNPDAYPVNYLYLDLLAEGGDSEEGGEKYRFKFLTEDQAKAGKPDECWFKVREIMGMQGGPSMLKWLTDRTPYENVEKAFATLYQLHQVVHHQRMVAFYEEKSQHLDRVLNIFIRMNSGGTVLSYSDLLLSIAVSQWESDARSEIHGLVDDLNERGDGFNFSKDLVLKAGLMLADIGNVGFKVENFNRANMAILEKKWPEVKRSLGVAVQLLAKFGFNEKTLRADSALLPVAYYICQRNLDSKYLTSAKDRDDREAIRKWLIRSLLKASGIWGSGLDTLLTALRDTLAKHGKHSFPVSELQTVMDQRGKSLAFTDVETSELVEMEYGDKRLFALLALLFPFVDVRNIFHIDHVFPKSQFTPAKLRRAEVPNDEVEPLREMMNLLPNLQLLEGKENIKKRASMPAAWLTSAMPSIPAQTNYCSNHLLGDIPDTLAEFRVFYVTRREALRKRITELLAVDQ